MLTGILLGCEVIAAEEEHWLALCKTAVLAISNDIEKAKPSFPELLQFDPAIHWPIIGNNGAEVIGYRIHYSHKHADVPKDGSQHGGYYTAEEGGVVFIISFGKGENVLPHWALGENNGGVHETLKQSGIQVVAFIDCPNKELMKKLEQIVRQRISEIK